MDRQAAEGSDIMDLEQLQREKKSICMNSKEDFKQCHSTSISYNSGSTI